MEKEMEILYSENTTVINMSKEGFANLFLINISIDEKTIPFIFDTGASISAISESVAKDIRVVFLSDSVIVGGNTNKTKTIPKITIPKFKIGNNTIKNLSVIVVPDDKLDFGFNKEGNSLKINGFLGWDIISNFKWTIDPHKKIYKIEEPKLSVSKELLYWDNMPIINVQYDNHNMYFGFDSGNTESMFSKEFIPFLITQHEKTDEIAGVGGIIREDVYFVNSIKLSVSNKNIELKNMSVLNRDVFLTKDFKVMGLLAADIIQNYKCIIDSINHDLQLI